MIQLNLLPDVKLEYIKAQRYQRMVLTIAAISTIAAVTLLVMLLGVSGLQKKHLNDLNDDIFTKSAQLKNKPQIDKILTVQNQLGSLTALHAAKPAAYNLFSYINEVTPAQISISNLQVDFTNQTMTITGGADSLSSVNQYVDTLKYTTYTTQDNDTKTKAFSNVVLASFSVSSQANKSGQLANYSITLSYDPAIFDIANKVDLSVPSVTSSRSNIDKPTELFQTAPTTPVKGAN
ncbi:MAG TPA: PilN domain-containing protein [Methylomirabilota bacterium]|nr:PilN domain-containing protein [Methylomirabilota bacterium]